MGDREGSEGDGEAAGSEASGGGRGKIDGQSPIKTLSYPWSYVCADDNEVIRYFSNNVITFFMSCAREFSIANAQKL